MKSLTLKSPAKLNLFLKVVGKRPDGFHELITLFERIALCDSIRFAKNSSGRISISCDHPQVPRGPKNLIYQVARRLKDDFAVEGGVDIRIHKRIPVAAGLAGGSSNAATALMGLNRLWKLGLSRKDLESYADRIGSDVAFFLHDCSWARGTGRGEVIRVLPLKSKLWHLLVVPRIKMYSGEVFTALGCRKKVAYPSGRTGAAAGRRRGNLTLTKKYDDVNILTRYLKQNDVYRLGKLLANDLEAPIIRLRPGLLKLKSKIQNWQPCGVSFSGSGPAVFALTASRQEADRLKVLLKKRYRQVFVVQTL